MSDQFSTFQQLATGLCAAVGFAGSTLAFRIALDMQDHRWMIGATSLLIASYIPYLALLGQSMTTTIVLTGAMSQILALTVAIVMDGETLTPLRVLGIAAALVATLAFSIPAPSKA